MHHRSAKTLLMALLPTALLLTAPIALGREAPLDALRAGLTELDAGHAEAALTRLDAATGTVIDDLRRFAAARARMMLGRYDEAEKLLRALARDPETPWRAEAARLYPDALLADGQPRRALRAYQRLLDRFSSLPDEAAVRLALAKSWRALKRLRPEAETLAALVWRFPDALETARASERLAELARRRVRVPRPTFRERLDRAARWSRERRFDHAHADLDEASKLAARSLDRRDRVRDARVRVWMRQGRFEDVIRTLPSKIARHPEKHSEDALALSTALRRVGRTDEGLAILRRLQRHSHVVDRKQLARAYQEEGRIAEADRLLCRVYRVRKDRPSRHWDIAWSAYRNGRSEQAIASFELIASRAKRGRQRALYWRARALADAGQTQAAIAGFRETLARDPRDYYGYQAAARLMELGVPEESWKARAESLQRTALSGDGRIVPAPGDLLATPPRTRPGLEALHTAARRHGELLPRLRRASALASIGRLDDARRELRLTLAVLQTVRNHPRSVSRLIGRPLSEYMDRRRRPLGRWGEDLAAVKRHLRRRAWKAERKRLLSLRKPPRDVLTDLREALRAVGDAWGVRLVTFRLEWYDRGIPNHENRRFYMDIHPLAWRKAVAREAHRWGVAPELVWGIMTVESAYNQTAHSVADARGLLQLLPRTAWLVAHDLGDPPPHPSELLSPDLNVHYGVWYIAQLLKRFQGQELFAAASYNAGPHRVAWRVARHADEPFDVVLEELPSWCGREYAKKVLRYIGQFRRVYLDDPVVYISQKTARPVPGIHY